ncbi:uncharacterized protein LOC131675510 [Phymastichus coffea]|uniref:uncharacterized protein LOC131675510 n=1 Tax=Phymastichus coffea TaxID=108790 RepID=UPI00273CD284|nr:uncharacterized protein LOC131675510 [Phymastichus coffea]
MKVYTSQWDSLVILDDILYREWISSNLKSKVLQLIVPRNYINTVLEEAHDSPSSGYFGVNKTLQKVRKRFYWASYKKDIENWCRSCSKCITRKGPSDKCHSIQKTRTTPLHPQSDGQVERQNRTIIDYLAKYISDNQKDWDRWIALYLLAYRSSVHATTGTSPAEMYTGSDLRLPLDLMRGRLPEVENPYTRENYVHKLKNDIDKIHDFTRTHIKITSQRSKKYYDRTARHINFTNNQKVWFFNTRRLKGRTPKLQSN